MKFSFWMIILFLLFLFSCRKNDMKVKSFSGENHGIQKSYYESGRIRQVDNYSNGILHGKQKYYGPEGKLLSEATYVNGDKHGLFISRLSPKIFKISNYADNQKHGIQIIYDKKNELVNSAYFKYGRQIEASPDPEQDIERKMVVKALNTRLSEGE